MLRSIVVFKHHVGIASRFANTVFDKKFFFVIAHISFHQPCDVVYEKPTNLVFIISSRREKDKSVPKQKTSFSPTPNNAYCLNKVCSESFEDPALD